MHYQSQSVSWLWIFFQYCIYPPTSGATCNDMAFFQRQRVRKRYPRKQSNLFRVKYSPTYKRTCGKSWTVATVRLFSPKRPSRCLWVPWMLYMTLLIYYHFKKIATPWCVWCRINNNILCSVFQNRSKSTESYIAVLKVLGHAVLQIYYHGASCLIFGSPLSTYEILTNRI